MIVGLGGLLTSFSAHRDSCVPTPPSALPPWYSSFVVLATLVYIAITILVTGPQGGWKSGLALAVAMGSAGFLISGGVLAWEMGAGNLAIALVAGVFVLSQVGLVATAIATYYSMAREAGDRRKLALAIVVSVVFFFILLSQVVPYELRSDKGGWTSPPTAIGGLRILNTAELDYVSTYGGYSHNLTQLGPAGGNAQPTAPAEGLIDEELKSGKRGVYTFTYSPGPPDAKGGIQTYTVSARPSEEYRRKGCPSFFTDQSGVIRRTDENRPATVRDTPVPG